MPRATRSSTGTVIRSVAPARTEPLVAGSNPDSVRSNVVFPAPFAPRTAVIVPVSNRKSMPCSTGTPW